MSNNSRNIKFVFFGTSEFAVDILDGLSKHGFIPSLVVTQEDKPRGRGLSVLPTPAKVWAEIHHIPCLQPKKLDAEFATQLKAYDSELFIVAAYGKLIPKNVFEMPPHKTLNVHPSLLPKLRGPSPIQTAILTEEEIGTTIMLISEGMDEGPIVAQEKVDIPSMDKGAANWPPRERVLEELLAKHSAELLARILPEWIRDKIKPVPQDESRATYCKKIEKEDGLINLSDDPHANLRKVRALADKPGTYLIFEKRGGKKMRVRVKDAEINDGTFSPTRVIPEGKKEMDWQDFLRGNS